MQLFIKGSRHLNMVVATVFNNKIKIAEIQDKHFISSFQSRKELLGYSCVIKQNNKCLLNLVET